MTANELMLGDYVQVNDEIYNVISISYFDIGISDNKKDFYHEHIDNIKSIPITAEILEKNGFKCEEIIQRHWISEDGRILLKNDEILINSNNKWFIHVDNEDMQSIGYFEITYVHELQHVLRLCNIEKKIKV